MHKILVDTCVWLDLAKDPEQQTLLNVIEELVNNEELILIVPRIVVVEFARNKERIIKECGQSLSGVFKRVKGVVDKFGDPETKQAVIEQLNDVDYKIPSLGEAAIVSITRIEKLLKGSIIIEVTDDIKLRAIQRAIENRAPFHHQKNSINDAIIIETYAAYIRDINSNGIRFAFVTHNKKDFSIQNGNDRLPHPDFASYFSKIKSRYFINLAEAVHRISPELVTDIMIEDEWSEQPRGLTDILEVVEELTQKIWYNRHQNLAYKVETRKIKLIDEKNFTTSSAQRTIVKGIWEGALKSAKNVEKKYGIENLGPWDDFEWGMLNGKLSALRWVLGEEWDCLDT